MSLLISFPFQSSILSLISLFLIPSLQYSGLFLVIYNMGENTQTAIRNSPMKKIQEYGEQETCRKSISGFLKNPRFQRSHAFHSNDNILDKLKNIGVRRSSLKLLASYLSDRKQTVSRNIFYHIKKKSHLLLRECHQSQY